MVWFFMFCFVAFWLSCEYGDGDNNNNELTRVVVLSFSILPPRDCVFGLFQQYVWFGCLVLVGWLVD